MPEIIEISTWDELLATVADTEYSWVGGSLDFNEIQPSGFTSTVNIRGSIDFNGATFFNFRSMANTAIYNGGGGTSYFKNITFQNIEHLPTSQNNGATFISGLGGSTENLVITGTVSGNCNIYILFHHSYSPYSANSNNRIDRVGCDISAELNCPFYLFSESSGSTPASSTDRIKIYDSRIKLDITHTGDRPFPFNMYNCKISGRISSTASSAIALNAFYSAVSLESNRTINCPNLNLVRSDLAEYTPNSRLVECEAPFYEYKESIADSGFPYNGAEWDGGD